jgi:transposase-like protein
VLSNHTAYDSTNAKIAALRTRKPGERHPYVIGNANILRYLTTAEECAKAGYLATSKLAGTSSR